MSLYGDISPRVGIYAHEQMLAHAEPIIVLQKMGLVKPVPKNKGETVKFRRPKPWTVSTTPLSEGVTPSATAIQYEDVSVTLAEYGAYVEVTDKIQDLHEDPVLNDQMMLAGENAAETLEIVLYNVLIGGTSVKYAGTSATQRNQVAAKLDLNYIREAVRNLQSNRGKKLTSILSASTNISTKPVEAAYVAFCHTDVVHDIRAISGFVPVAQYGSRQALCPEEVGAIDDVRFVCSPLFAPWTGQGASVGATGLKGSSNIDVYPVLVTAKEAFGCTPLKGMQSSEIKVLRPGEARGGDPLGQRGSVGWKAWFQGVRLNESWMRRIEVGVTAL